MDKILEHGWYLQKNGYRESTITSRVKSLKGLTKRTDLFDPEKVKVSIAQSQLSEGRKELLSVIYAGFAKQYGLQFTPGRYRRIRKLPFIPTEEEINQLIGGVNQKTATYLLLVKETGARANEAWCLRWVDIDFERQLVTITPEKNSNPRRLRISSKLVALLNRLPRTNDLLFGGKELKNFSTSFQLQRRKTASKLNNPRIKMINFRTLRHYYGSMTYMRTKDILFTMRQLGHKRITNTMVYLDMVQFDNNDNYICKAASTIEEAKNLVEDGFDYVTDVEGCKLFRKRK